MIGVLVNNGVPLVIIDVFLIVVIDIFSVVIGILLAFFANSSILEMTSNTVWRTRIKLRSLA